MNTIERGDCVAGMNALAPGSVDLAFADPPFNIGYEYDVYDDRLAYEKYLEWSRAWIGAVHRVLKPDGTFWLAIGDEFAAELKLASQQIGFHTRSWVVWYYTFGVNCTRKFTRSHAHLFYFVNDPQNFTFLEHDPANRIPSARQLVYNDNRANPKGRLPDDTWIIRPAGTSGEMVADDDWLGGDALGIDALPAALGPDPLAPPRDDEQTWTLRPQDLSGCFTAAEDTWYFPRVAGTFKERAGFHGCQMPEQLLGRIIRACSREKDVVLDPFSGSATTLAVARKLGRQYIGFELSAEYAARGCERLAAIRVGDALDGSPEPLVSAPKTRTGRSGAASPKRRGNALSPRSQDGRGVGGEGAAPMSDNRSPGRDPATSLANDAPQLHLTLQGVVDAFRQTHDGFSADRVVADPALNARFANACRAAGLLGEVRTWNTLLFRLRKAGRLAEFPTTQPTKISWEDCDGYLFASEIALATMLADGRTGSIDEVLCDPLLAGEFDATAARFAPGNLPLEYRWAALKLRKQTKLARSRAALLVAPARLGRPLSVDELLGQCDAVADGPGAYLVSGPGKERLYVGETLHLRARLAAQFGAGDVRQQWADYGPLHIQTIRTLAPPAEILAWQSCLARKYRPRLNLRDLCDDRRRVRAARPTRAVK